MACNAELEGNTFTSNKGVGGTLKIVDFPSDYSTLLSLNRWGIQNTMIISNSKFVIDHNSDCSLFFKSGNSNTQYKLVHSSFTGNLAPNSHHIDGIRSKKHHSKLVVEKCRFDTDVKKAVNLNNNNKFVTFDIKSQTFKENKGIKFSTENMQYVVPSVIGLLILLSVVLVIKYKNNDDNESNDTQNPLSSNENNVDEKLNPLISN